MKPIRRNDVRDAPKVCDCVDQRGRRPTRRMQQEGVRVSWATVMTCGNHEPAKLTGVVAVHSESANGMSRPSPNPASAGLSSAEALRRRGAFGANTVPEEAPAPWRSFFAKFWGPVPWMLEATFVLQLGLRQYVEAAVVGALLLFNATLGFIQEGRAGAALAALKKRLAPSALALRDGEWIRLAAAELVPGDAIKLSLGALVPADATLTSGSVMVDRRALDPPIGHA